MVPAPSGIRAVGDGEGPMPMGDRVIADRGEDTAGEAGDMGFILRPFMMLEGGWGC